VAHREVKTFIYSCDHCGYEVEGTSEQKAPFQHAYYKWQNALDFREYVTYDELCQSCYSRALKRGYTAEAQFATLKIDD
jgi:ribosomal protein L37AE/L43A